MQHAVGLQQQQRQQRNIIEQVMSLAVYVGGRSLSSLARRFQMWGMHRGRGGCQHPLVEQAPQKR